MRFRYPPPAWKPARGRTSRWTPSGTSFDRDTIRGLGFAKLVKVASLDGIVRGTLLWYNITYLSVPRLGEGANVAQIAPGHKIWTHLIKHHTVAKMLVPNMIEVFSPARIRIHLILKLEVTEYAKSSSWWAVLFEVRQHMILEIFTTAVLPGTVRLEDVLEETLA